MPVARPVRLAHRTGPAFEMTPKNSQVNAPELACHAVAWEHAQAWSTSIGEQKPWLVRGRCSMHSWWKPSSSTRVSVTEANK